MPRTSLKQKMLLKALTNLADIWSLDVQYHPGSDYATLRVRDTPGKLRWGGVEVFLEANVGVWIEAVKKLTEQ